MGWWDGCWVGFGVKVGENLNLNDDLKLFYDRYNGVLKWIWDCVIMFFFNMLIV